MPIVLTGDVMLAVIMYTSIFASCHVLLLQQSMGTFFCIQFYLLYVNESTINLAVFKTLVIPFCGIIGGLHRCFSKEKKERDS